MSDEEYLALVDKAMEGALTDDEHAALDAEARARVSAELAAQAEG